jgi:hypothetical protein
MEAMPWSDDTRCLYCDGKLPLYRKLTSGQFCSAAHHKAYWQEQERLAVERLHQTHDSLKAHKQPKGSQAALSRPVLDPCFDRNDPDQVEARRAQLEEIARTAANTGQVVTPGFLPDVPLAAVASSIGFSTAVHPLEWDQYCATVPSNWIEQQTRAVGMAGRVALPRVLNAGVTILRMGEPLDLPVMRLKMPEWPGSRQSGLLRSAGIVALPASPRNSVANGLLEALVPYPFTTLALRPRLVAHPDTAELDRKSIAEVFARDAAQCVPAAAVVSEGTAEPAAVIPEIVVAGKTGRVAEPSLATALFALPRFSARGERRLISCHPMAEPFAVTLHVGPLTAVYSAPARLPRLAGLLAPRAESADVPLVIFASIEMSETSSPRRPVMISLATPASQSEPRVAPGHRYRIENPVTEPRVHCENVEPLTSTNRASLAALDQAAELEVAVEPGMAGPRPLQFNVSARVPGAWKMATPVPAWEFAAPANPPISRLALEPAEGDVAPPPKGIRALRNWLPSRSCEQGFGWSQAVDFWQNAPRDLKILAVAIPLLLGLALRPSLPKVQVKAPTPNTAGIQKGFERRFQVQLENIKRAVAERAGVALNEEFRMGLDDWHTRGDLAAGWSFDRNGFVKPVALAFYKPSMSLTDYDAQFLGLIDKKALSFVARAKDFDNYYVIKINITKPGPIPSIGVTRYAVVNGTPQDRVDTAVPVNARPDMLYRVGLNVRGDSFVLTLQGQIADSWTEPRLKQGGIGFFASKGEESRLRWVQVTHQYDMLGRLCAYLAPQNISNTNGSW